MDDYIYEEAGTPDLVYLIIWVAVCLVIALLFKFQDKFNGEDEERLNSIFSVVIVSSMMGAMYGFFITLGAIFSTVIIDSVFSLNLSDMILNRVNLIVLFFASINVSSLYYALRNGDRVAVLKKNEQVVRDKINFPD